MKRVDAYEPLCYHCLYGLGENGYCTIKRNCNECSLQDEYGNCYCVKEKPDDELTCPRFIYRYLRG